MSIKLSSYVWDGCSFAGLKLAKIAVMARLADFSSDEGVCWPSIKTIARQIGAGVSTVRRLISELERDGWLVRQQRRKGNRNASNMYYLNIAKLKSSAEQALLEIELEKVNSQPLKSSTSDSHTPKLGCSKDFDPPNLSAEPSFDPPKLGDDPSLKHDPSLLKEDPSDIHTPEKEEVKTCEETKSPNKTKKQIKIEEDSILVLEYLNQKVGSGFKKSKSSLSHIQARLTAGVSVESMKLVIDFKSADWLDDLNMSQYLRPKTLFSDGNFQGYLSNALRWDKKNRPEKINGQWVKSNQLTPATSEVPQGYVNSSPDYVIPEFTQEDIDAMPF